MTRPARFLIGGVIIGALVAGWLWSRKSGEHVVLDLVDAWATAKQRLPEPGYHSVSDVTISGDTRKSIVINMAPSRIAYELAVPEHASLKLAVGMLEKSWTVPGDGVTLFLYVVPLGPDGKVMFADGRMMADELVSLTVNPYGNPSDKLWHDMTLDLSKYAGKRIELRLVTVASPNGQDLDRNGDFLAWGHPRVVAN